MAEEPNEVKRHIDSTRRQLGEDLNALEYKIKRTTDWRSYVEKSPLTMVALAFTGGLLTSVLSPRTDHSRRRHRWDRSKAAEPEQNGSGTQALRAHAADTWDSIKGALIGVATSEFKNLLTQTVPGFREQYQRTEEQKTRHLSTPPELARVP